MSFDVTTLALAKSYTDQHGGSGGGEEEIFKIPVTVTDLEEPADGEYFKVEHTITFAEIEAAIEEGKTPIILANHNGITFTLSLFYYYPGGSLFALMLGGSAYTMMVGLSYGDEGETPKEVWQYQENFQPIDAENVRYYNPNNSSLDSIKKALDKLLTDSHTHVNKDILDKLSVSNGKLQYNSSDILIKSDKQEIVNDVLAALPTWTGGAY